MKTPLLTLVLLTIFFSTIHAAQSLQGSAAADEGLMGDWKREIIKAHQARYQQALDNKKQLRAQAKQKGMLFFSIDGDEGRDIALMIAVVKDLNMAVFWKSLPVAAWANVKQDFARETVYGSLVSALPFFQQKPEERKDLFFRTLDAMGYNAEKIT